MKRLLLYLFTILSVISCKTTDEVDIIIDDIDIAEKYLTNSFETEEAEQTIEFSSTTDWSITPVTPEWLTISPMKGEAGDIELTIEVEPNRETEIRSTEATITAGSKSETISISQAAFEPILSLSDTNKEVEPTSKLIEIELTSNIDWTTTNTPDWIEMDATSGSGNQWVYIQCKENTEATPREVVITFSNEKYDKSADLTISQKAAEIEEVEDDQKNHDGEVITLQKATIGKGINLIIVGDGFDATKMSAGGEYETRMAEAMEHFFSEEPYPTLRNRFNVYLVKAVSIDNGVKDGNQTVFSTKFPGSTVISGDNETVFKYAMLVPGIESREDLTIITVINSDKYAGTCNMYFSNNASIAYCPITGYDATQFRQVITHEAGGHGFGKLLDEYSYSGTITDKGIADFEKQRNLGWAANVDITDDPATIRWSHFLSDARYSGEVGVYEGALTYVYGVYRPSDTSIMRYISGGYNAPSREAIYQNAMRLSGEEYSYEEFVEYDAINRTAAAKAKRVAATRSINRATFIPLANPVIL